MIAKPRSISRTLNVSLLLVAAAAASVGAWPVYLRLSGNFHEVAAGVLYRSAQPNADSLSSAIKTYGIRTVINLRGESAEPWYTAERKVSDEAGVTHIDLALSAGEDLTDEQLDKLVTLVKDAPRPVLVHCRSGADRTGLASAAYELVVEHRPPEQASGQLSFRYGHFPWLGSSTAAMNRSFERLANRIASNK